MKIKDVGELKLIDNIRKEIGFSDKLFIPIGDDTAAFELRPPFYTLLTTDSQVKDVHFKTDNITPEDLGYRCVTINVSDIAAMAGIPKYCVVALGLEKEMELDYVSDLYKGMKRAADDYNLTIAGGDVSSSSNFFINLTALGEVEPSLLRRRGEAAPGHIIYVTGKLGGSAAGLAILENNLQAKNMERFIGRHNRPKAKVAEGRLASESGAKAMQDISDGLVSELNHICTESGAGAVLEAKSIPLEPGIGPIAEATGVSALDMAITSGEEYELVFTAEEKDDSVIQKAFELEKMPLTKIGRIVSGDKLSVLDENGNNISFKKGWEHLTGE